MSKPYTQPGTLDLSQRLTDHPYLRAEIVAARAACDADGHPSGCFNPHSATTYCRCGFVQYPGNSAPFPQPWKITPRGKYDNWHSRPIRQGYLQPLSRRDRVTT